MHLTDDGINWYTETLGTGPDIILIPSGEGDCTSFTHTITLLSKTHTVTTFDMPGMSRSTAPPSALENLSASKLAAQILKLLDVLSIQQATFYGCSSGGLVALAMAADHPDRVRNVIVHEVPLAAPEQIKQLKTLDDATIMAISRDMFASSMVEDEGRWKALGEEYHARLDKNCVTWVRHYVNQVERAFSKEELTRRPVTWTVGALTPTGMFFQNVVDGFRAGIEVGLLPSKHFPQVTIPEVLAGHIRAATEKFSSSEALPVRTVASGIITTATHLGEGKEGEACTISVNVHKEAS